MNRLELSFYVAIFVGSGLMILGSVSMILQDGVGLFSVLVIAIAVLMATQGLYRLSKQQ